MGNSRGEVDPGHSLARAAVLVAWHVGTSSLGPKDTGAQVGKPPKVGLREASQRANVNPVRGPVWRGCLVTLR